MSQQFFIDGSCVFCATAECNDLCLHYGAPICRKTLMRVGEALYMKGLEALGVRYYSMALYAEKTLGLKKVVSRSVVRTSYPKKKAIKQNDGQFESIRDRYQKQEAIRALLRTNERSSKGMFGVFAPTPINRSSAMSFQRAR